MYQPVIAVAKSSSTSNASVGQTVTYSFIISNSGNYPATISLTDNIPAGTSFVPNSAIVGGNPVPGVDPVAGIPVGSIAAGSSTGVMFSVVIDSLPNPQQLSDTGTASISYTLPDGRPFNQTATSNTVTFPVSAPNASAVKAQLQLLYQSGIRSLIQQPLRIQELHQLAMFYSQTLFQQAQAL